MRRGIALLLLIAATPFLQAGHPPLDRAMLASLVAPDAWAFTQHIRQYERDGDLKEERVERYDPSRPLGQRWVLLRINGRAPNPAELTEFAERKARGKGRATISPMDCIDLARVAVAAESSEQVSYRVPLRADASRLVPLEKVSVAVTVDKESRQVEQITADMPTPLRLAFGLARVLDMTLDLRFGAADAAGRPTPSGTARVSFVKLGNRGEIAWSDFQRVSL